MHVQALSCPYYQSAWMSVRGYEAMFYLLSDYLRLSETLREIAGCFLLGAYRSKCPSQGESNGHISFYFYFETYQ